MMAGGWICGGSVTQRIHYLGDDLPRNTDLSYKYVELASINTGNIYK